VTIGLNLKSPLLGLKDLIKVEHVYLTEKQTAQVALFSPSATVNVIRDYKVTEKYKVQLPEEIAAVLSCPNRMCITNLEKVETRFFILESQGKVRLRCSFCEKIHFYD
jgi:aspartate carbamoyltransferase regulatory subunit